MAGGLQQGKEGCRSLDKIEKKVGRDSKQKEKKERREKGKKRGKGRGREQGRKRGGQEDSGEEGKGRENQDKVTRYYPQWPQVPSNFIL